MRIPALSEHRLLRFTTVTMMYIAQGIQIGLFVIAFPAYLAAHGISPLAIGGFISALTLPWTLKLLYAPLMERYTVLAMGRRRPWILLGMLGASVGYLLMSLVPDPLGQFGLLTALMVGGSLFLALQDIATDAFTIDVIPLAEQSRANGLMWGGKVLGGAATAAVSSWLLNHVGVSTTLAIIGATTLLFGLVPLLVRERPGERMLPWTSGAASPEAQAVQLEGWAEIARNLRRVVVMPATLLTLVAGFTMQMCDGLMDTFGPVFTVQHLGWTDAAFSNAKAIANIVGGVGGMVGGGLLVRVFGRIRAIQVGLAATALIGVTMALAAPFWSTPFVAQAYLALFSLVYTLAAIAFFATCMALCWKPVAAIQFSLFMAVSNVGLMVGSNVMGWLLSELSVTQALFVTAAVPVVAILLFSRVDVAAHVTRIAAFDDAPVPPPDSSPAFGST